MTLFEPIEHTPENHAASFGGGHLFLIPFGDGDIILGCVVKDGIVLLLQRRTFLSLPHSRNTNVSEI